KFPIKVKPRIKHKDYIGVYPIVPSFEWLRRIVSISKIKYTQLRIKNLDSNIEEEIEKSIIFARENGIRLFINDYWELAIKYKAYGVHLGQSDILTADIDRIHNASVKLGV